MSFAEKVALNVAGANLYGCTLLVIFCETSLSTKHFSHFRSTQEYKAV